MAEGITVRHRVPCASWNGDKCSCRPAYRAKVQRDGEQLTKTFPTLAAARSWRAEQLLAQRRKRINGNHSLTLRESAEALIAGMRAGTVRNKSGNLYRARVIDSYEMSLRTHIYSDLGAMPLPELHRVQVQALVDRMAAAGYSGSTIRNTLLPLRVLYRQLVRQGGLPDDSIPLEHLSLPASNGRRDRIVSPAQVRDYLDQLRETDRALWGSAFYAGMRRGEIMALRWEDIDTDGIHVRRSYDDFNRVFQLPKTSAGIRTIPLLKPLSELLERLPRTSGLVFGNGDKPFTYSAARTRAYKAWRKAELEPIQMHEARHFFASVLAASKLDLKSVSEYMGHSSIQTTLDLYAKLFPGSRKRDTETLNRFLEER